MHYKTFNRPSGTQSSFQLSLEPKIPVSPARTRVIKYEFTNAELAETLMTTADWKNKLYFDDNLDILRNHVDDASVHATR